MRGEKYEPIDAEEASAEALDASVEDAFGEDETVEEGPALVTCVACAHPNLEFRNHCRKCGSPLQGAANIIPGVEYLEWTATDGPSRKSAKAPKRAVAGLAALAVAGVLIPALGPRLVFVIVLVAGAVWLALHFARNITGEHLGKEGVPYAAESENGMEHAAPDAVDEYELEDACPECGEPVKPYDDVCPECGALVVGIGREH